MKTTPVDERRLDFKVRFQVKDTADKKQTMTINIAKLHKSFMHQFLDAAVDATFLPSNTESIPLPRPFTDLTDFPATSEEHKRFFRTRITSNTQDGSTLVHIEHRVIMTVSLKTVKTQLMSFLRMNKIFILSDHLNRVETQAIAWCRGAHPVMTYRPEVQRRLNLLLEKVELTEDESKLIEKANVPEYDGAKMPPFNL